MFFPAGPFWPGFNSPRLHHLDDGKLFLYSQKTGVPVRVPLPDFVIDALRNIGKGERFFWSGVGNPKSCVADWQRSLSRLGKIAGVKFHAHQLRDSFAASLLSRGVPLESVVALLGNSVKVCERHYAPWLKVRQDRLEEAVRRTFADRNARGYATGQGM